MEPKYLVQLDVLIEIRPNRTNPHVSFCYNMIPSDDNFINGTTLLSLIKSEFCFCYKLHNIVRLTKHNLSLHMAYCSKVSVTTLICTMTSSFNARFLSCAFSKFGSLCYNYVQLFDVE